ncbi:zinc finger protein 525-like [Condylostylus longicornis]|uniref:zinc finger protein 525-like n=1 Tax=Condylostylus longicornis TaxID=2530218 RepID=UPI00244E51E3|nr:zinc finger protein 525-like [Condylostylus longicornis]
MSANTNESDLQKEYEAALIGHIARRQFMYDTTHEHYTKLHLRRDAWQEIARDLNRTVKELKNKWEALRYSYRKYYRKINNRLSEGKSVVKWVHYERMQFLNGHIKLEEILPSEEAEIQKEFDSRLIKEIEGKTCLYDPMSEYFANMKVRTVVWKQICEAMKATAEVCKKRWYYLRETFRSLHKKETEDKREVDWVHYKNLQFLLCASNCTATDIKPVLNEELSKTDNSLEKFKLTDEVLLKWENESENMDCFEYCDVPDEKPNVELDLEVPRKCGEILITKTENFSYKCCICNEIMLNIEQFSKHILDKHMGRNETVSIFETDIKDALEKNESEIDFDADIFDGHDSNVTKDNAQEKSRAAPKKEKAKRPAKYNKKRSQKDTLIDESLKENPDNDPETATLKRKIWNQSSTIERVGKYRCKECCFSFDKEENLKKHEEVHQDFFIFERRKGGEFKCDQCDKTYTFNYLLQRHKRLHTGERPYACTMCDAKFRHYNTLKEHYVFRHSEDRPFPCRHEGCGKSFKTKVSRTFHETIHSKELKFQCDECGKRFPRSSYLKRHRGTWHMDKTDRPYKCPTCPKSFCTQRNLKYHIYTHTGERPSCCTICPAKFAKPCGLKEHMKVHTGEKNYSCDFCGKNFARRTGLMRHRKTHGDIKVKNLETN